MSSNSPVAVCADRRRPAGALQRAVDQRPDRQIETSGVAQPAKVATSVAMFGLAMTVVVLADAERIRHSLADRCRRPRHHLTAPGRPGGAEYHGSSGDPAATLAAVGAVAHGQ